MFHPGNFNRHTRILDRNYRSAVLTRDVFPVLSEREITLYDHTANVITLLRYASPFQFPDLPSGHPFHFLCRLTQDGNYMVLLGPIYETVLKRTAIIDIYQVALPVQLIFHKIIAESDGPFIGCNPIGIAMSQQSIAEGRYQLAILSQHMALILFNLMTLKSSTLRLKSVSAQYHTNFGVRNAACLTFSPDGQVLTMFCFMDDECTNACLIIDVGKLEPLFWIAAGECCHWQQWLFPMFSACGTKMVLSTKLSGENDESKYELMFYDISLTNRSLKNLCRDVILEFVGPAVLHELPLPQDIIAFLGGTRPTQKLEHNQPEHSQPKDRQVQPELNHPTPADETKTHRCNLL